jgi:probable H4MPT-linked C1 transfer pathway protein
MREVLGLDIGGANLKAAHSRGVARTVPFALWKEPEGLSAALRVLVGHMPRHDLWAVTMTGELCDCFASKQEGVEAILQSVKSAAGRTPVRVWTTYGQFLPVREAREESLRVAAANWLAGAALAGSYAASGAAVCVDVGSTTTDIIELWRGKPVPSAWTDMERLKSGELVYTGVRRTPLCALLGPEVAAELFATTLDVYLALGLAKEDAEDCGTADGRPATKECALVRLARMFCGDSATVSAEETRELARSAMDRQAQLIRAALQRVRQRMPEPPDTFVLAGSGEFLARSVVRPISDLVPQTRIVSLAEELGPELSEAACAYAVALLAAGSGARAAANRR